MLCSVLRITVCLYLFWDWPFCLTTMPRKLTQVVKFTVHLPGWEFHDMSTADRGHFHSRSPASDTASESAVDVHAQACLKMAASPEHGTGWGSGECVTTACSVFIETVKLRFRVEPATSHPPSVSSRLSASSPPFGTLICACSSDGMIAMVSLVANDAGWHLGAPLSAGIRLLVKGFFRPLLKSKKLFFVVAYCEFFM